MAQEHHLDNDATRLPDHIPNTIKSRDVIDFLHTYYDMSNNPHGDDAHKEFAALFTDNGTYGMNAKVARGRDQIVEMRKALFAHIPDRDHDPIQIYTHGDDEMDLMVQGDVKYRHHYGHETDTEWAARYRLVRVEGQVRFSSVSILFDGTAHG